MALPLARLRVKSSRKTCATLCFQRDSSAHRGSDAVSGCIRLAGALQRHSLDNAMTRDPSHPDPAPADSTFDFIACLAARFGIEKHTAREMLGRWMATYEPVKPEHVTSASARPTPSGVFRRPDTEDAGHAGKVGSA